MTGNTADYATKSSGIAATGGGRDAALQPGNFLSRAGEKGMNLLGKGNDIFNAGTGANLGLNMDTLKAAALPASTAIGDAMYQEAKVAEKDYERALREYNEEQEAMGTASNEGRRQAIISAMTGNHSQEVIDETLAELGLRDGGRVAYNMGGRVGRAYGGGFGGIEAAVQTVKDRDLKENLTIAKDTEMDMKSLAEEFLATYKRQPNSYDELMEFYKKKNGYEAGGEEVVEEQVINAANGGIMGARVPFVSGGGVRGLINAAKFSDEAPLMLRSADEVPSGLVDEMGQPLRRSVDEVDISQVRERAGPGLAEYQAGTRERAGPGMLDYTAAGNPQMKEAAKFIEAIRTTDGSIDYVKAEEQIGMKLNGNETIEELIELFLSTGRNDAGGVLAIGAGGAGLGALALNSGNEDINFGNVKKNQAANGGMMGYNMGGSVLPNGVEMDYRGGGFIPMGSKERADDVPARVSKNEFVMTADAVRAAGGGSVNKGAKKMYELMNNLEARA